MRTNHLLTLVVTSLAAASCAQSPTATANRNPAWMIGEWGWESLSGRGIAVGDCSPENEFYRSDGYVVDGDRTARWWIEGDTLVREYIGKAYGEDVDGEIVRNRFSRIYPDELLFEGEGGARLVRCGDVPAEWDSYPVKL